MDKKKFKDSRLNTLPSKSELTAEGKFRDARADQLKGPKISPIEELNVRTQFGKKSGLEDKHQIMDKGPIWKKHDMKGTTFLGDTSKVEEHLEGFSPGEKEPKKKRSKTLSERIKEFGKTEEE